ncbi:MAG: SpoIIE family protein phosphatase, partial [Planctomycetes bacterium]|nr:SpoIIE family protein phosphatase [Planctomycetota bacterium]
VVAQVQQRMALQLMELESFVTLCYARFDLVRRQVLLVDCGHTRTMHSLAKTGECRTLHGENMPLGFVEEESYRTIRVPFDHGDRFLFYSDGVIEAAKGTREKSVALRTRALFGEERLSEYLRTHHTDEPESLIHGLREEVVAFTGSQQFADDLTCIAVCIEQEVRRTEPFDTMTISSELYRLPEVRRFVESFVGRISDISEDRLHEEKTAQLELAVVEAISNVIRHAYQGQPGQPIWIEARHTSREVEIRILHQGRVFSGVPAGTHPIDNGHEGGFGLYIIAQSVDDVVYGQAVDGKTFIRLKKTI